MFINQVGYCDRTYLNQILTDQFVSSWYNDIEIHLEDNFMALSKKTGLENYLVRLNEKTRIWMTKLRASNLRIPIELGGGIILLKMRGFELYVDNQLVMSSTCYLFVLMHI